MFSKKIINLTMLFDLFLPLADDGDDNIVWWGNRALEFSMSNNHQFISTPQIDTDTNMY